MKIEGQGTAASQTTSSANETIKVSQGRSLKVSSNPQGQTEENAKPKKHKAKDVEAATEVMNEAMKICNYNLEFKFDKESARMQVKVIDADSQKVIREIPSDQILECSARIRELIDHMAGVLVDERI